MRKAKKLLVTLLVLVFMLSTFSVGFAAEAEEKLPDEVVRAMALGILKGDGQGNLNLDKPITRAEALALIVRISGLEGSADLMAGQTEFTDVNTDPSLQWATGYINLGVGQGIVNGYPDGTFKGNNQVTYAEMAKMILYAMNYGVTVEGAPWPAGVMGKADDLGLFDDVNALPNVPALRGDVVKMIDNSLTVNHLKQTGYGDFKQYEEDEDTNFLTKLDVEEVKDVVVTEIAKVNSKLDDDEIVVTDEDGDDTTYVLAADVTPEEIFGLTVDAWVNDDDEIFFVKVDTDEDDIMMDTVTSSDEKEVGLKVEDDTFEWAEDAKVYVNFKEVDPEDVSADAYGMFVVDKDEIIFANLFDFDIKAGVVVEVEDDEITYNKGTSEKSLDLDDYDDGVYVYDAAFKAIDADSIEADDVIYAWEDGDELYLVVAGEVEEGTLDRAKTGSIKLDGESYDVASNATASDNEDDDIFSYLKDNDLTDTVVNLVGEEVEVILDINGEVRHVRGDAEATSGTLYGLVTDAYRNGSKYVLDVFNQEGEDVALEVEKKDDWAPFVEYFENNAEFIPVAYELNKDGEIEEGTLKVVAENGDFDDASGAYTFDYAEDVTAVTNMEFGDDDDYIKDKTNDKYYYIDDTILMTYENDTDEDIIKWEDIEDKNAGTAEAYIVGEAGKDADFVVFYKNFTDIEEDTLFGIVTEKPAYDGDDWVVTVDVNGEGEVEYIIDKNNRSSVPEGKVIAFTVNSSNEITVDSSVSTVTATVYDVSGKYIKFEKNNGSITSYYKMNADTVVYDEDEDGLDNKLDYDDVDEGDLVEYIVDDNTVKAILIKYEGLQDNNNNENDEDYVEGSKISFNSAIKIDGNYIITIDGKQYIYAGDTTLTIDEGKSYEVVFGELRGETIVLEVNEVED